MTGLITRGVGGFYYVKSKEGIWQCRARGTFRKEGVKPCVGDEVIFEALDEEDGVIDEILPRRNVFVRPPVSNIDSFAVVMAAARPKPNLAILDKFLVTAEQAHTDALIILNKSDLAKPAEVKRAQQIYEDLYPVLPLSALTGEGFSSLPGLLKGKKTAFAGPSGAGKTTIINRLQAGLALETGELSRRTQRGRHTTRHVEIFDMDFGAMIYDTPGFTSFELQDAEETELAQLYPEMRALAGKCRFDDCRHLAEPGCAVKQAVEAGRIAQSRYASYAGQYQQIEDSRAW